MTSLRNLNTGRKCLSNYLSASTNRLALPCHRSFVRSLGTDVTKGEKQDVKPFSQMPGLKSVPILGSLPFLIFKKDFNKLDRIHIFWSSLAKEYGKILTLKIPGMGHFVMLSDPDDIEKMFKLTMKNPIRDGFHSIKKVRQETIDNFFENKTGLLAENNDEWWRVRSRVQTPMMKPSNIVKYLPKVDEVAQEFMEKIDEFQAELGEMPETFIEELYKWALESLSLVALNKRLGCFDPNLTPDSDQMQLIHHVNVLFESLNQTEMGLHIWKLIPNKPYKNLKKSHEIFMNIILKYIKIAEDEIIQKRQSGDSSEDTTLLEILLQTEGLTRKDIITMMMDMFFAGIDTTTHSIGFTLYCLAKNPKIQERLHQELDEVMGDGKDVLTQKHLAKLSFTKACVKESMRLFPLVLGAGRTLEEDAVIGGFHVPKGHLLVSLQIVTSNSEEYFQRSKEFLPQRWGRDKPLGPIHPYASLPFSHGTRMCIGRRIAEQEMYTFLARVMHRYNVDYKYDDIKIVTKFVSSPSQPLRFEFTKRK